MSHNVGLRTVNIPKLLPVLGTWTFPFTAYLLLLSSRVCFNRVRSNTLIGERSKSSSASESAPSPSADPLQLAYRAHVNFLENVPLAFVLAGVAELNGANKKALNGVLLSLLTSRVAHAELGIMKHGTGRGRIVGYYGTSAILLGLAGWSGWLVKGYWGL